MAFLAADYNDLHVAVVCISTPLLIQAWAPFATLKWNVPSWSLSNEALFYLLFPLLLTPLTFCKIHILLLTAFLSWWAIALFPIIFILMVCNGLPYHTPRLRRYTLG